MDSWIRTLDPADAAQYAYMLDVIEGAEDFNAGKAGNEAVTIRAIDDYTFQVQLVGPTPTSPT